MPVVKWAPEPAGDMRLVVGRPVLLVGRAAVTHGLGDGLRAVCVVLEGLDEFDRPSVLALAAAKLEVGACAGLLGGVHDVAARGLRLRGNQPRLAGDVLDPLVLREKTSAFLPKVRFIVRCHR